jgi:hypothetical protein
MDSVVTGEEVSARAALNLKSHPLGHRWLQIRARWRPANQGPASVLAAGTGPTEQLRPLAASLAPASCSPTEQLDNVCQSTLRDPANTRLTRTIPVRHSPTTVLVLQTCPAAEYVLANPPASMWELMYRTVLTPPGTRGRLRDAPVAESDEEQAQGRPDRPRLAQAEK